MIPYLALMLFWVFLGMLFNQLRIGHKHKTLYCILAGFSLFLIMALRNVSVGTDTMRYLYEYENAEFYLVNLLRKSEIGYSYFNYGINKLGLSFQAYLAIVSIVVVLAISILYNRYSKRPLLSYFLHINIGLFAMTMTGLRQSLAVALTIVAFISLMKNRKVSFFLLVIIASFFHNSALAFLPVFFLKGKRIKFKSGVFIYVLCCLIFPIKGYVSLFISRIVPEIYLGYFDMTYAIQVNPLVILVAMAIPLVCLVFWPSQEDKDYQEMMSALFLLSCVNFVVYFLALEIMMFERISLYFMMYNTILIPNVIHGIKSKEIRMIALMACIILPLAQFLISTPGGSLGIDKYKFFWE